MSKILLTGMSAPQASSSANSKSMSFAAVLNKVFLELGHTVDWVGPDIKSTAEDLETYDLVLVGVSPLTSLSANRVYGALSIIDIMWSSPKLKLFIDAPKVDQITFSIKSIHSNPESLVKLFFSYRKDFNSASSDEKTKLRLLSAVDKLMNSQWPDVIYPALPWANPSRIKKLLPENLSTLTGINLDIFLLKDLEVLEPRRDKWVVDTYKTKWTDLVTNTLAYPHSPMRWNKGWTDVQVFEQISRSLGVLISPHKKDGTWWTYRYIQALNTQTPISTEWKESCKLGDSWSILATSIEAMPVESRKLLAMAQKDSYIASIPTREDAKQILETTLGLTINKENNE